MFEIYGVLYMYKNDVTYLHHRVCNENSLNMIVLLHLLTLLIGLVSLVSS